MRVAGACTALALIAATASDGAPTQGFDARCGVFPAADVPAGSPSLPDQRAWNQDISESPVAPNSDQVIDYINGHGGDELHPDFGRPKVYGIPFTVVRGGFKGVRTRFVAYGDESDKGRYKIPLDARIEGGRKGDGDRHTLGFDRDNCKLYELYRAFPKKNRWNADSGAIWDLKSAGLRQEGWTSADAAGLPIFPGLTRYDEVKAGEIDHALRVTFESTRDAYIHPASHCAGDTSSAAAPPMGMRFRLKASYDTSAMTGQAAVIARALKQYGLINADNGSNWFFSGATNSHWNDDNLNQLKEIPGDAFEVVQSEAEVKSC